MEGDMGRAFNPNQATFEQGLERIRRAVEGTGLDQTRGIITSRDDRAREAQQTLKTSEVPDGFAKWQLPVYLGKPSQLFITVAQPDAEAPEHSHDEGDGIRFIASGSIIYNNVELTTGDWMFIPAGTKYSFKAGAFGALMCYCYCCCCVPRVE
jgi:quercetin dioxygenase-like cupin family protein